MAVHAAGWPAAGVRAVCGLQLREPHELPLRERSPQPNTLQRVHGEAYLSGLYSKVEAKGDLIQQAAVAAGGLVAYLLYARPIWCLQFKVFRRTSVPVRAAPPTPAVLHWTMQIRMQAGINVPACTWCPAF